jgi:hypothetical protein
VLFQERVSDEEEKGVPKGEEEGVSAIATNPTECFWASTAPESAHAQSYGIEV